MAGKLIMKQLITFVLLELALSTVSLGSPTIDNPCQNVTAITGTPQYLPLNQQIQQTITTANMADAMCQQLKSSLATVLRPTEIAILNSPLQNVPGLPLGFNEPTLSEANMVSSFKKDYGDVSTYIMYIQYMKTLQVATDRGKFVVEIDAVINQLYTWLCKINTILRSQNNPMTQFVDSSVVSEDVKEYATDSKSRYMLNYIIMKNAHDFISNKNIKLATYLLTLG